MFQTFKQKPINRLTKELPSNIRPVRLDWEGSGSPAQITLSDGSKSLGSCIRCFDAPCLEYSKVELELPIFKDFPADQNDNVCATSAISWLPDTPAPFINPDLCIVCGICVSRCPVGAIYIDGLSAHINDAPNEFFIERSTYGYAASSNIVKRLFYGVPESGAYCLETDDLISLFRQKLGNIFQSQGPQFPNHLARNLLIAVGIGSAMRRRGDVNIRMDLVLGPPGIDQGTSEVELGTGVLDAPRNILDNIAVLVARYELSKENIVPLIVSLDLPNLRSEYWQFIKDVRTVLGVKINSITIGALVVMVWARCKIRIETGDELYIDIDTPSLRSKLTELLGRELKIIGEGYPGFLESAK